MPRCSALERVGSCVHVRALPVDVCVPVCMYVACVCASISHVRVPVCARARPRRPRPVCAPHLLVVDVGQGSRDDLQQEDDEEQGEVYRQHVKIMPNT